MADRPPADRPPEQGSARYPAVEDPQRGRRKVPRAIRERQMLDVAGRVFAARGFHQASMDEIAAGAGISKPMIYSYFGSKEGLYFAYIELAGQRLVARMDEAASAAGQTPEDRLWAAALAFFSHVDENREEWSVLWSELAARGAPFSREVDDARRRITRQAAAGLKRVLAQANVPDAQVGGIDPLAHAYVGAGESLANWWLDHPEEPARAMAGRLLDVGWVGLRGLLEGEALPTWRRRQEADRPDP